MKKIITLILAAALTLGASFTASAATEFKASGSADFLFNYIQQNSDGNNLMRQQDPFAAYQQFRTAFNFTTSENLYGSLQFRINTQLWGSNTYRNGGASLGTDGINIQTRQAYINFTIPDTDAKIRMGLQGIALPSSFKSPILDSRAAAISLALPINNVVSLTAFWARPYDNDAASSTGTGRWDEEDLFGITVPIKFSGVQATPWIAAELIGRGAQNLGQKRQATAFWLGLPGAITSFDPLNIKWDFNYGNNGGKNVGSTKNKIAGWYGALMVSYKLDMFTPAVYGWYASGVDKKGNKNYLPFVYGNAATPPGSWGWSSLLQAAYFGTISSEQALGMEPQGTWGIGVQLTDISFINKLTHNLRFAYITGTSNKNVAATPKASSTSSFAGVMTTKDSAYEVNFDSFYKLYDELALALELGYAHFNWKKNIGTRGDEKSDNIIKAALGIKYSF